MDVLNVLKNVIAIIGIIAAGAFVIVFLADLLISIIDGKNGIFFKRGNVEQKQEPVQEQQPRRAPVLELEEKTEKEDVRLIEQPQQNVAAEQEPNFGKVDFEKADEEERLLRERLQLNVVADEQEIDEQIRKDSEEEELRAKIRELEEKNRELTDALLNTTAPEAEAEPESVEHDEEDSDDMIDYFNEYKDIIDSITAEATEEEPESQDSEIDSLPSIDEILSQTQVVEPEPVAEPEPEPEPVVEPEPEPVQEEEVIPAVVEEPVAEEPVAEPELNEEDNKLLAEIEELRRQLEEEKARMEEVRQEAMYKTAMLEGEKERLAEELRIANEQKEAAEAANKEVVPTNMMSKEEYEARLETLKERLKANEKQLRVCKKEYKPLERVNKTLNSDKQKLRRKEAIVAKQKVLLYGVNNYVDIDEEKAKKLAEDLDLLDGLRLSVQHCEEVMNANRDRFPILEQTYKILTETNKQIIADIKECEANLEEIKKAEAAANNADETGSEDK